MITIKILLIALVVFITIQHASAPPKTSCENLIHQTGLFKGSGVLFGIAKFKFAYFNITVYTIQPCIDAIPSYSEKEDHIKKIKQARVTFGYFHYLHRRIYEDRADLNFKYPEEWCKSEAIKQVEQMRESADINPELLPEHQKAQEAKCLSYIVPQLFDLEGYIDANVGYLEGGRKYILDKLYLNWSHETLNVIIYHNKQGPDPHNEMPGVWAEAYTLGYFDYVGDYVHSLDRDPKFYKSVHLYCLEEGCGLINEPIPITPITPIVPGT